MPLPNPEDKETQDEWIERCMGNDTMKGEFPDNKQRLAVCFQKWRDKDKKKDSLEQIQRRFCPSSEVRVDESYQPKLVGYAALFNVLSEMMWGTREKIAEGAFIKSIEKDDVRMLWNHDPNYVLARTKSGTLKLKEDNKGLYFEAIPPDTQWAKDLLVTIKRGDVSQNSFGFIILDDEWDEDEEGIRIRTLKKVKLFDVSPVTYPAYIDTELSIRGKWGEITFNYDELKSGTQTTIANIIRANEKAKVKEMAHRYGISGTIYSVTEPNPTLYPVNSKDKAQPSFVEAKPKLPLIDPIKWERYKKYL